MELAADKYSSDFSQTSRYQKRQKGNLFSSFDKQTYRSAGQNHKHKQEKLFKESDTAREAEFFDWKGLIS